MIHLLSFSIFVHTQHHRTIRGDFAIDVGRNVIHGSDTVENGKKEIGLWFPEGLVEWVPVAKPWIYE